MSAKELVTRISELHLGNYESDKGNAFFPASVGAEETFKYPLASIEEAANKHADEQVAAEAMLRQAADSAMEQAKQDRLAAGANITIEGNTISSKDTVYDDSAIRDVIAGKQDRLAAGANITIEGNTISAGYRFLGSSDQIVRGDGSLMYRARGYPFITGIGTVSYKCAQIRWLITVENAGNGILTIDSREYLEGDVVDVLVLGFSGANRINGIDNSGNSKEVLSGAPFNYVWDCVSYRMIRFVKTGDNLKYLCIWKVDNGVF